MQALLQSLGPFCNPLLHRGSEAWTVHVDFEKNLNGEYWMY